LRYGEKAEAESAKRWTGLAERGDDAGVAVWMRIIDTIGQLSNTTPLGPYTDLCPDAKLSSCGRRR
jgi:hypothetical protein